jgi:hypothetical protein
MWVKNWIKFSMFALAIRSSTTGAIAQPEAENDCILGVVAMLNFAQTNLSTQETLLQLSVDKLKFLTTFKAPPLKNMNHCRALL